MWVGSAFDTVDKARNFREERVVVSVSVTLLVVVSRATNVESRCLIRVDQTHVVSIRPNLEFTSVGVALKCDGMGERTDSAVLVFPDGRSQTGDSELFRNLALVDRNFGKFTWSFVVLNGSGSGWSQLSSPTAK